MLMELFHTVQKVFSLSNDFLEEEGFVTLWHWYLNYWKQIPFSKTSTCMLTVFFELDKKTDFGIFLVCKGFEFIHTVDLAVLQKYTVLHPKILH